MSKIKKYIDVINSESNKIVKFNKSYAKDIKRFNQNIEQHMNLYFKNNELEVINEIKQLPYLDLNIDKKIEDLKAKIENSKDEKGLIKAIMNTSRNLDTDLKRQLLIKQSVSMFNEAIAGINKELNNRKDEIYIKNREKLVHIENFIIRRLFVEYAQSLVIELKHMEEEVIKAFIYNIEKSIEKIKSDEDNWMLGKNFIRNIEKDIINGDEAINVLRSKSFMKVISQFYNNEDIRKYVLDMYSNESLRNNIKSNKEIIKIAEKIDILILDFIDIINDSDSEVVSNILEDIQVYEDIISNLGYEEIMLSELDKLDTELCMTLEAENTEDIEKDFLISKIHRKGYKSSNKVLRRTIVNVFRFTLD
ncbi:hypothetical protein [Clostridium saudiense]|uniref:hypothetical protein n=1 Tax=Clostridium saudiense TaxID=1414720 RepID=UPI0026700271|nr:hypothetical protein [Clostridium saudiense]